MCLFSLLFSTILYLYYNKQTGCRKRFEKKNVHAFKDGVTGFIANGARVRRQWVPVEVLLKARIFACYLSKGNEGEEEESECKNTSPSLRSTCGHGGPIRWVLDGVLP